MDRSNFVHRIIYPVCENSWALEQIPRYLEIIYMHAIYYGTAHPIMRHLFFAMLPKMVAYLADKDHSWDGAGPLFGGNSNFDSHTPTIQIERE